MQVITMTVGAVFLAISAFTTATAEQATSTNVGAQLPPKIRGLLIQEMQGVNQASQQVHAALVQGQHAIVATKAQEIHDSFIMAQQMTDQEKQTLHDSVPEGFLALDQSFHGLSASLAQAARDEDTERELQHFSEMTQTCVACHSQYASGRFPGL